MADVEGQHRRTEAPNDRVSDPPPPPKRRRVAEDDEGANKVDDVPRSNGKAQSNGSVVAQGASSKRPSEDECSAAHTTDAPPPPPDVQAENADLPKSEHTPSKYSRRRSTPEDASSSPAGRIDPSSAQVVPKANGRAVADDNANGDTAAAEIRIPRHSPAPSDPVKEQADVRIPRHSTIPVKDEYQPAPAPTARAAAPSPGGDYSPYGPPPAPGAAGGDVPRMPSGLTSDVDAVLERIFHSGLFGRKDIDGRALGFLGSVAPPLAMAALEDIQNRDFSTVRNKPAFIMSCFKRVVAAGGSQMPTSQPPPGGYPPTSVPASALAHLPPAVSEALQRVFTSGVCHPSQFDDRAMDILVDLHEGDAVRALSEFAAMEPGRVRNPSAFWMGLTRKYKSQARRDPNMGGYPDNRGGGGGDGYNSYGRNSMGGGFGAIDQRLQDLINNGMLPPNPLDDRALDALRRLPEPDALSVLSELPEPHRIRNMSAYVMGLCKKFASGEARSQASRGYGPGPGGAGNNNYIPNSGGPQYDPYPPPHGGGGYGGNGYGPSASEVRRAIDSMESAVRDRFYGMVDQGMFPETAFDDRAISTLQNMQRDEACAALDELAASLPGPQRIHNISAYFMGLAKKFAPRGGSV